MQGRRAGDRHTTIVSVAVLNFSLHIAAVYGEYDMHRALRARGVIAIAKGILMARHVCSEEEAFGLLMEMAEQQHLVVSQIAAAVVARDR